MQVGFFSQQGHYPRGLRPALSSGNAVSISTAQGGGGSYKNRKPTGEVGCYEKSTDGPVVGAVFFGVATMVPVVTSPQLLDVVVVVVVVVVVA